MLKLWIISVIMGCIKKKNKKSWDYSLCQHVKSGTCKQISDKETQTQTGWLAYWQSLCVQPVWPLSGCPELLTPWLSKVLDPQPLQMLFLLPFPLSLCLFFPPPISASTFLCPVFMFYPWTSVPSRQPNSSTLTLSLHPPTQSYLLVFLLKFIISSSSPKSTPLDLFLTIISCRSNCVPLCCVGVTKDVKQKWVRWSRVLFAYTPNGSTDTGQVGRRQLFL